MGIEIGILHTLININVDKDMLRTYTAKRCKTRFRLMI